MVKLDIEKINSRAPYKVHYSKGRGWLFVTDCGIRYGTSFRPDDMIHCSESYQFILSNFDEKPSPRDPKLRDTIVAIIQEFFESNQSTMLYLCETEDGKQGMRSRLFAHWFKSFASEDEYIYRHTEVMIDGVMNFLSIILRRDNPDASLVLEEWDTSVLAISEKPK